MNRKRTLGAITAAAAGLGLIAATAAPVGAAPATAAAQPKSIAALVSDGNTWDTNSGDFDILEQAVKTFPDIAKALSSPGNFTVFAPTDRAFLSLASDLANRSVHSEQQAFNVIVSKAGAPAVKSVLTYHVLDPKLGRVNSATALTLNGKNVPTLNGATFRINVQSTHPLRVSLWDKDRNDRNPRLVPSMLDIQTGNGIVHVIDGVLRPVNLD